MAKLLSVKRFKDEPIEKLLKRFKKKVVESDHLSELKNRQEFVKPSLLKRRLKQEAIRQEKINVELYKKENGIK